MALGRVGRGAPSSTHAHSFLQTQRGPAVRLPKAKEKTRQGVSAVVSEHRRQCAQCAGTREGPEQREGLAKASSSWGQARPSRHLGRLGGLSGGEAGALSNSATATAGQAAAWQLASRRQGWRA